MGTLLSGGLVPLRYFLISKNRQMEEFGSKEEFQKYRQDILDRLDKAIKEGKAFLVIADGDGETMATMGGNLEDLTAHIGISMYKARKLKAVVETGVKFAKHLEEKEGSKKAYAEVNGADMVKDILDQLGCEECPGKDECEIFKLAVGDIKGDTVAEFVKALVTRHPELATLVRGVTMPMSKGGDA